jgi:signal transduction histidine kinase
VELEKAQSQLLRRERLAALGELAALVAHEVRNPLGVIFNCLGSLAKLVELDGDARRVYEIIREEADRLNRIVGDMLDYTRPSEPQLRPGALDRVLADALQSARASEKNRGTPVDHIHTSLAVDAELPPVPMDERLVHQAMVNLLSNALQSVPKGGHVRLSGQLATENGRRVARIEVADDGPGIPEELTARLFEPFFTTKATGSGLGLAVVKRIVDGHRGEVGVRTSPGQGTTFIVDLPLEPPEGMARTA